MYGVHHHTFVLCPSSPVFLCFVHLQNCGKGRCVTLPLEYTAVAMDEVHLTALDLSCMYVPVQTFMVQLVLLFQEDIMCNNFSMVVCCVLTFSLGRAGRGKVIAYAFIWPIVTQY